MGSWSDGNGKKGEGVTGVGPARCCSPRHRMPLISIHVLLNLIHVGTKYVSMTRLAIAAQPFKRGDNAGVCQKGGNLRKASSGDEDASPLGRHFRLHRTWSWGGVTPFTFGPAGHLAGSYTRPLSSST